MNDPRRASIERLFAAVEAKDLPRVLAVISDDALLSDPQYAQPVMRG